MSPEEGDERTAQSAKGTSERILDDLLRNEGRYFLLSTQSYSRSYAPKINDASSNSNSYFTKYIIEGLKGFKPSQDKRGRLFPETGSVDDKGYVTPESLYRYVSYKIRNEIPQQEPVIKGSLSGGSIILAEYPELAPLPEAKGLQKSVDLSKWVKILNSGQDIAFPAFSAIIAMETSYAIKRKPVMLSARYLYEKVKKHDEISSYQGGTFLSTVIYVIQQFGVIAESVWPFIPGQRDLPKGKTWTDLESEQKYYATVYSFTIHEEILDHLRKGRTILAGIEWFREAFDDTAKSGIVNFPSKLDTSIGGHTIVIVGYDPKTTLIRWANTWGTEWGDHGFCSMSMKTFKKISSGTGLHLHKYAIEANF